MIKLIIALFVLGFITVFSGVLIAQLIIIEIEKARLNKKEKENENGL